ncbi:MAG: hypothetical protein LBI28_08930 [Treponema sp.]|jgi:hypothetical protein|nr:hypothetical protein [Treponema sp.]
MKKIHLLFGILFCISVSIFSQARTNETLPVINENTKTLSFVGWVRDHAGQWQSAQNMIPSEYWDIDGDRELGLDNISTLKLYSVVYALNEFYVLEVIKKTRQYRYPITNRGYYYVFEKSNFNITIEQNVSCINNLTLYSSFSTLEPLNSGNMAQHILRFVREPQLLLLKSAHPFSVKQTTLGIPTFYFTDDNAVRFFINGEISGDLSSRAESRDIRFYDTLQDNFYYECSYDDFINFSRIP